MDPGSADAVRAAIAGATRPELDALARAALDSTDAAAVRAMAVAQLGGEGRADAVWAS
jgi:hypothetical protein